MNPILLKPERDTASQVVVMGHVDHELSRMDWRTRSLLLWDRAREPLRELLSENDLVILEGAGSPAETNLASCDYVNLFAARPDQTWSPTDCISFSVMTQRKLTDALTADRHFEQAGFRALLRYPPDGLN